MEWMQNASTSDERVVYNHAEIIPPSHPTPTPSNLKPLVAYISLKPRDTYMRR